MCTFIYIGGYRVASMCSAALVEEDKYMAFFSDILKTAKAWSFMNSA